MRSAAVGMRVSVEYLGCLTPRHALQQIGTEVARAIDPNVWVRYVLNVAEGLKDPYNMYDRTEGAAAQIRGEILALRDAGCAVLVVSEELDELFEVCDRLHVIARGQLSPSVPTADATVEKIGEWMSGLWDPEVQAHLAEMNKMTSEAAHVEA